MMKPYDPQATLSAIPIANYAFGPISAAQEDSKNIDLAIENEEASKFILMNKEYLSQKDIQLIIVPGYTPLKAQSPQRITNITVDRLERAVQKLENLALPVLIVSGGNVYPQNTPYNEAYGMKRYLIDKLGLKNHQVAMDVYARHSTTNLRNCGRFMKAHELNKALIVTSLAQSFYFSFPAISTFNARCKKELGYVLGKLKPVTHNTTTFEPSDEIWKKGTDLLDV